MARTFMKNEVPVAGFNLRTDGPLSEKYLKRKLGKHFRIALGRNPDVRATVDKDPCPDCNAPVEWATTSKKNAKGGLDRYVYARCRGNMQHRWSFGGKSQNPEAVTPVIHKAAVTEIPAPRPSAGAMMTEEWAHNRISQLEDQLAKYRAILSLSHELAVPIGARALPQPPVAGATPTPPHQNGHH